MTTKVSSLVAALAIGSALALGACGGGGGDEGAAARQTFLTKGDALCKATIQRVVTDLALLAAEDPGAAVAQALPAFESLSVDLKAIPPPPGDAEAAAIIATYDGAIDRIRSIVAAREAGNVATEQAALSQLQSEAATFTARVKAYGFKECGLPGA